MIKVKTTTKVNVKKPQQKPQNHHEKKLESEKYSEHVNAEGVTRVTRQEVSKKLGGNDDQKTTKSFEQAAKKDPSFWARVKKAVKSW